MAYGVIAGSTVITTMHPDASFLTPTPNFGSSAWAEPANMHPEITNAPICLACKSSGWIPTFPAPLSPKPIRRHR